MHLLIYTPKLTSRIQYIFDFIFKDILKSSIEFTNDRITFIRHDGAKINYSESPIEGSIFFKQCPFLLETRISSFKPGLTGFGNGKAPFPVNDSALPFDVFAASFYILTRYEEYNFASHNSIEFSAVNSLQHTCRILQQPVIDEWALLIKNLILTRFPEKHFGSRHFLHLPVIRIDLYPLSPVGLINKSTTFLKSLTHKDGRAQLFDAITGMATDADKNLNFVNDLFRTNSITPFFFIDGMHGEIEMEACRILLNRITVAANFGVLLNRDLALQKKYLSNTCVLYETLPIENAPATLQLEALHLPDNYLQLLESKISADFSMGYLTRIGFRAGTCTPFRWYDLQVEKETALKIYPYCITDNALQLLGLEAASDTCTALIERLKMVDGLFCSNWSLKSLSENVKFKKWKTLYLSVVKEAAI